MTMLSSALRFQSALGRTGRDRAARGTIDYVEATIPGIIAEFEPRVQRARELAPDLVAGNGSERARVGDLIVIRHCFFDSPVGTLLLAADGRCLKHVLLPVDGRTPRPRAQWSSARSPVLARTVAQLEAYFRGELIRFDVPLAPEGTPFQQAVWDALLDIPYGETRSYGEVARRIGRPSAFRAVGAANGRNPIAIVIPCHRVIGAGGDLTGFGGGLDAKRTLLDLEGARGNGDRQRALF